MQLVEPTGDFSHLRLRGNDQALENKRRNEMVNEILRPPPQPFAREERQEYDYNGIDMNPQPEMDDGKTGKASNPFGSESPEQKAARQQHDAEADIRRYKEERKREQLERSLEKQRDLQMLQSYYPWGRPGHGAPLGPEQEAVKKRKFLGEEDGRHQQQQQQPARGDGPMMAEDDWEQQGLALNRPGHGAPLRTESGRLVTQLPGDPALRFRGRDANKRGGRDPADTLRYKNPDGQSYARELELHMQQQTQQREMERAYELQEELNSLQYDPYGKPGAGAPNQQPHPQHQQQQQQHQQQHHQRRQQEAADLAALEPPGQGGYEPWGKGYGSPQRDQDGRVVAMMRQPLHDHPAAQHPGDHSGWSQGQNRNPMDTQSAPNPRSPLPPLPPHQQQQQPYSPFGRPGAGAPLRDREGHVIPSVYGATTKFDETPGDKARRAEAARMYSQELERGLIEQSLNKKLEVQQRRAPVDNPIADQLARGSVGKPSRDPRTGVLLDQHLPSSDVTHINYKTPRHKFKSTNGSQHLPDFVQTAEGYGSELERAAVERAAARRLDRAREIHEADRHAQAFDRMFGRPGAGAPSTGGARKVNLDRALHNPDGMRNEYKKPVNHVTQMGSTPYVRNPTNSTHDNGYEVPSGAPTQYPSPSYNILAPYAVQRKA